MSGERPDSEQPPATGATEPSTPSYEDLVPGSLAWIAATHGGGDDEPSELASGEVEADRGSSRVSAKEAKAQARLAARRAREERRAAARAEKQRAKQERAQAKRAAAERRAEERRRADEQAAAEKAEREEARRLADERAAVEKAEAEERRRADEQAAAEKARRREESKAAAVAALGGDRRLPRRDRRSRPDEADGTASSHGVAPDEAVVVVPGDDDTALLEAVGAPAPQEDAHAPDAEAPDPDAPANDAPDPDAPDPDAPDPDALPTQEQPAVEQAVPHAADDASDAGEPGAGTTQEQPAVQDEPPVAAPAGGRRDAAAKARARADKAREVDRRRREKADAAARRRRDDVPEPPAVPQERGGTLGRLVGVLGVAIGVLGLAASVVLALAALLVAFGFDDGSGVLQAVATVADPLTAPLRGLVTFSGENAAAKEAFVVYGGGSVVYLVVGVAGPTVLRRRDAS